MPGILVSKLAKGIDDAQIEITFTTMLAYGTFLLTRHLNLSGVIAPVAAGLIIGNIAAKTAMSRTNADGTALFLGMRLLHHRLAGVPVDRIGSAAERRPCCMRSQF